MLTMLQILEVTFPPRSNDEWPLMVEYGIHFIVLRHV